MAAKKIALFIDADNISAKFGKQIIETLEVRGEIFIRRIYGNWEKVPLHGWNECILNFSLRAIQQPDFVTGKNATDMSLVIDAMDVLHDGKAEIFALVSNDSDFTPLAIRLREGGMKVIGLGNSQAANSFRAACHEFFDLDAPVEAQTPQHKDEKKSPAKDSDVQLSLFDEELIAKPKIISADEKLQAIHDALRVATEIHGNAEGFVQLNYGRLELKAKNFDFTVKDFGYAQLRDFIAAYPEIYEVRGEGKDFSYRFRVAEIHPPPAEVVKPSPPPPVEVVKPSPPPPPAEVVKPSPPPPVEVVKPPPPPPVEVVKPSPPPPAEVVQPSPPPPMDEDKIKQIHNILRETAKLHGDADGFTTLSKAGNALSEKNISLKNSEYGTLKNFIAAFSKLYEVKGEGPNISYRCLTLTKVQPPPPMNDAKLQKIHNVLRETAKLHGGNKGFVDLSRAGEALGKKNISLKGSGHSTVSKFIAAFPKLYEVKGKAPNLFYRCR